MNKQMHYCVRTVRNLPFFCRLRALNTHTHTPWPTHNLENCALFIYFPKIVGLKTTVITTINYMILLQSDMHIFEYLFNFIG